jgi:L,D-peptidoglycan transpeptidase YkuD (ErfK/YbiS/YcfS/YnhG family)
MISKKEQLLVEVKMKKAALILILFFMILSISGCKTENETDFSESSKTDTVQTTFTSTTSEAKKDTSETSTHKALSGLARFLIDISDKYDSSQIILAFPENSLNINTGKVYAFEMINEQKIETVLYGAKIVFGRNGLDKEMEGDKKAPSGVFYVPFAFGTDVIGKDLKIEYRIVTEDDYWVDDTGSDDYNTWQTYEGDPKTKWNSFERLMIESYRLAFVIDYNSEREKGKGSAIFFHVWKDSETYTSGCTAAEESTVFKLIKWFDIAKKPIIVQGTLEFFESEFEIDIIKEIRDAAF